MPETQKTIIKSRNRFVWLLDLWNSDVPLPSSSSRTLDSPNPPYSMTPLVAPDAAEPCLLGRAMPPLPRL